MADADTLKDDPPEDAEEIGSVMSNCDHQVEEWAEEKLKSGNFLGNYPGWNFHAQVWWDGSQFAGRVKTYRVVRGTYRAATLAELMEVISDRYGYD